MKKSSKVVFVIAISLTMVFSMAFIAFGNTSASQSHPEVTTASVISHSISRQTVYSSPNITAGGFTHVRSVPANTELNFEVYVPLLHKSMLNSLVNQVSTHGSPLFDHFMNYSQIEKEFMNTAQFNTDKNILQNDGFRILMANDPIITAQGTEAQIQDKLGLHTEYYSNGTAMYYYAFGTPRLMDSQIMVSNISQLMFAHPSTFVGENQIASLSKVAQSQNKTLPLVGYSPKYLEQVYNATGMYKLGYTGKGQTIGILDFGGDPYIKAQLSYFDREFNISAPPSFNIVPIGPYQPIEGVLSGWSGEISLDVESSHTMAPGANITLYIANLAFPLAPIIASIDQQGVVNDLSQSFSIPESAITSSGLYTSCVQTTNEMYEIGSLEGITFSSSSGDVGASGFSTGPLGTVGYPATSPYVTSVGGTSTYLDFNGTNLVSFNQTAWSNYGFVPPDINYGGSTGGVSYMQPILPYQNSSKVPKGYPEGKTVPDLSFEASIYPGFEYVMPGNITGINGGTSEASPILAGLLTLADQELGHKIGNIEPALYYLGKNDYKSVFMPITSGYNIPFTDSYGYNLVNGWGSLNIGAFANAYGAMKLGNDLSILVSSVYSGSFNETECAEYQQGQTVTVQAFILTDVSGNLTNLKYENVTTGSFHVSLVTLTGNLTTVKLTYNATLSAANKFSTWIANVTVPMNAAGPSYFEVYGHNGTQTGMGTQNIFLGDYLNILYPGSASPFSTGAPNGLLIEANLCYLNGTMVKGQNATVQLDAYSIFNNTYYKVDTTELVATNLSTGLYASNATYLIGDISGNFPDTASVLIGQTAYSYTPFMNGAYLQGSVIFGPNVVEPGAVGAGQYINVLASVSHPLNEFSTFADMSSNVTFALYSPEHKEVSSVTYQPASEIYDPSGVPQLFVPDNATPGLYTILINSTYFSQSSGIYINGSFYGQIYVTSMTVPSININSITYEGQTVTIRANITYPNGTEVKYGMYSATFYPKLLSSEYSAMTAETQIAMNYNASLNEWVGHFTLPSTLSDGSFGINYEGIAAPIAVLPPGQYEAFVSGISANAYPTSTAYSAQKSFEVAPYIMLQNERLMNLSQTFGLAFKNDSIHYNGTISNSIMLGKNDIDKSNISLSGVNINGTLFVNNSTVYLFKSMGLNVVANNSKVVMISSNLKSLELTDSKLQKVDSSVGVLSPSLPVINVVQPSLNSSYSHNATFQINITGSDIGYTQVFLGGHMIYNTTAKAISFTYNVSGLPDGAYPVEISTTQTDGMISHTSAFLNVNTTLNNLSNKTSSLSGKNSMTSDIAYGAIGLGSVGTVLGVSSLLLRKKK